MEVLGIDFMKNRINTKKNEYGFTLVELLVALVISAILSGVIYSAYVSQQDTQLSQEQVAEMQQNLRSAMMVIVRDIRMAGYDPNVTGVAGFTTASVGQVSFTQDITGGETDGIDNNDDGTTDEAGEDIYGDGDVLDTGEQIDFGFSVTDDASRSGFPDADNDGSPDVDGDGVTIAAALGRQIDGGGYQPIADNIQIVEFRYLDVDANVTATLADVRSVQISILARAAKSDRKVNNTATYVPASGAAVNWGPYNDNYRRRLLITTVNCRNMGI